MTHSSQNHDVTAHGGIDLPPHLVGDSDVWFDAPTDPITLRAATLLSLSPDVKANFRAADLSTMDDATKQKFLDSIYKVLGIPQIRFAQL